jgi:hypothetical protein
MLTRKHFVAMAEQVKAITNKKQAKALADSMVKLCQESNPRFDVARFLVACGLSR